VARQRSFAQQAAEYTTLALLLPLSTAVGWVIGYLFDQGLGTKYLNIVGLVVGSAAGLYQIIRHATRDIDETDG